VAIQSGIIWETGGDNVGSILNQDQIAYRAMERAYHSIKIATILTIDGVPSGFDNRHCREARDAGFEALGAIKVARCGNMKGGDADKRLAQAAQYIQTTMNNMQI